MAEKNVFELRFFNFSLKKTSLILETLNFSLSVEFQSFLCIDFFFNPQSLERLSIETPVKFF